MYILTWLNGPSKGRRLTIRPARVVIGREPGCDIRLTDSSLAARHALLEREGHAVRVTALTEEAPVLVNGAPVRKARLLDGDRLTLGRVEVQFQERRAGAGGHRRRFSHAQRLALLLVTLVLLAEALILAFLFLWRSGAAADPAEDAWPALDTIEEGRPFPGDDPGELELDPIAPETPLPAVETNSARSIDP